VTGQGPTGDRLVLESQGGTTVVKAEGERQLVPDGSNLDRH